MSLAMSDTPSGPLPRHATVGVRVGQGDGGGHGRRRRADRRPVDDQHRHRGHRGDRPPGRGALAGRLRDGADHRRPRRGRRRRAAYPRRAFEARRARAADRRLPLYRTQAARRSSGLRRGARQVSHQSWQCRLQEQARPAIRQDRRDRDPQRQAGAHRRQLGFARSGAPDCADGRKRGEREAARGRRGHARGHGPFGAPVGGAGGGDRPRARPHHPLGQGLVGSGPDHRLPHARASAPITRCISA